MTSEEYAIFHPKAFRCAFDFLNAHFPPQDDEEWWKKTAQECSAASAAFGENVLVMDLLTAVMNYLGNEHRRRYGDGKTEH